MRRRRGAVALGLAILWLGLGSAVSAQAPATPPAQGKRPPAEPGARPGAPPAPSRPGSANGAARGEQERTEPVTVDADHLESLQKEGVVIFTGNVVARQGGSTQYADRMEVYLDAAGDRVVRTVSVGNVRIITRDCKTGTAKRAEYYDLEQRVILIGDARVWQDDNVVTGDRITMYLAEDRSVVEGGRQDRVKAVFQPRREPGAPSTTSGANPCQ
ncbi:MAG: lipopolysaccharide transport periplasmic protein LptA [Candidatus Rokubacteria bacterium]|nr:lipopolysaccharide transport periplasmic protein LptA [Candidatus Rokubacteria bacterium]